jgi:hypothetical protein
MYPVENIKIDAANIFFVPSVFLKKIIDTTAGKMKSHNSKSITLTASYDIRACENGSNKPVP